MPITKNVISRQLTGAGVALANATGDPAIAEAVAAFGYNAARLAQIHALLDAADAAVSEQVAATGAYRAASAHTAAAESTAQGSYQGLSQVARAALRDTPGALATLGIEGPMPRTRPSFITRALALLDNAVAKPDIAAALAGFGYTADKLAAERAKVQALIDAVQAQEAAKGEAQHATAAQDAAMKVLNAEMSAFRRVAKVALRGQPQLLEKLGILQRATRTEAQRHAGQKAAATREARKHANAAPAEPVGVK